MNALLIAVLLAGSTPAPSPTPTVLTTPLNLFVDPVLGNDKQACTSSGAGACQTVKGAIDKVRYLTIRALVKVSVAAGNITGWQEPNLKIEPPEDGSAVGLHIFGARQNSTLATGTATGTVTSVTAGTTSPIAFTVINDTGNSFTSQDLKGRYIEITSGPGVGNILPIVSNTATGITIPTNSTLSVSAGNTYTIEDMASIIATPIQMSPSIVAVASTFVPTATPAGIVVQDLFGSARAVFYRIECFRIALPGTSSTVPIVVQNAVGVTFARIQIFQPTALSHVSVSGPAANLTFQQMVWKTTDNAAYTAINYAGASTGSAAGLSMSSIVVFKGGNGDTFVNGNPNMTISGSYVESAFGINYTGPCFTQMFGVNRFISSGGNQALRARATSSNPGGTVFQLQSSAALEIDQRAASTGVELDGLHYFQFDGNLQIDSAVLTGINISNGARVKISAASGDAATNQITYNNGATTDTLANMRAIVPPHFSDTYFSTIYQ